MIAGAPLVIYVSETKLAWQRLKKKQQDYNNSKLCLGVTIELIKDKSC